MYFNRPLALIEFLAMVIQDHRGARFFHEKIQFVAKRFMRLAHEIVERNQDVLKTYLELEALFANLRFQHSENAIIQNKVRLIAATLSELYPSTATPLTIRALMLSACPLQPASPYFPEFTLPQLSFLSKEGMLLTRGMLGHIMLSDAPRISDQLVNLVKEVYCISSALENTAYRPIVKQ